MVENLSFVGNSLGQYNVESRNTVGGNHYEFLVVDVVNVAYFAVVNAFLAAKGIIRFC